jgi:hypothetical protein
MICGFRGDPRGVYPHFEASITSQGFLLRRIMRSATKCKRTNVHLPSADGQIEPVELRRIGLAGPRRLGALSKVLGLANRRSGHDPVWQALLVAAQLPLQALGRSISA